jgi:hypothetical protein
VWPPPGATAVDVAAGYAGLFERGYEYGQAFRGLAAAWSRDGELFAEVAVAEELDVGGFGLHPALLDAALHPLIMTAETGELRLPFVFLGVRLHATGASTLRVRLAVSGDDVAITAADQAGQLVLEIDSLRVRAVSAQALAAAGAGQGPVPAGVDWVSVPITATEDPTGWACVGEPCPGLPAFADLDELAAAGPLPAFVAVRCEPDRATAAGTAAGTDLPRAVRRLAGRVLGFVQSWVGDERFAGSRLVFVTSGAGGPDAPAVAGVVGGAVWGLVRSAQSEHPDRFVLLDAAAGFGDWSLVSAAVGAGEPQLAMRDGVVLVPRLARNTGQPDPDGAGGSADLGGDGAVLVTGGTGGLGALVAERLVTGHGVRHLVLVSRRGPAAAGAPELVARLAGLGASARVVACDVGDRAEVADLIAGVLDQRPLVGVVHAAGVLDDATVEGLSAQRLETVFRPKVDAAWYLHELTADLPLSMFMVFSSIAGVIGNPGQGNYSAANAVLDGLAGYRRAAGLPGVSVAWGLWDTAGAMGCGLGQADLARMARSGIAALSVEQGLAFFDLAVRSPAPLLVAGRWDTAGLAARAEGGTLPAILRGLVRTPRRAAAGGPAGDAAALAERLAGMAESEGRQMLTDLVRSNVAAVLAHARPRPSTRTGPSRNSDSTRSPPWSCATASTR